MDLAALLAEHEALRVRVAAAEARAEAAESALRVLRHHELCDLWRELHALSSELEMPADFTVPDLGDERPALRRILYATTQSARAAACWQEVERLAALLP